MSKTYTDREIEVKIQQLSNSTLPLVRAAAPMLRDLQKQVEQLKDDNKLLDSISKDLLEQKSAQTVAKLHFLMVLRDSYQNAMKKDNAALAGSLMGLLIQYLKDFNLYLTPSGEVDQTAFTELLNYQHNKEPHTS